MIDPFFKKSVAFWLLSFSCFSVWAQAQNPLSFREAFSQEYEEATYWVKANKLFINKELGTKKAPFLISLVFPEIVRFEEWKNVLELSALELAYVQSGSREVDFSVGYFQMKLSFIEYLENQSSHFQVDASLTSFLQIKGESEKEIRRKRLDRLKELDSQLRYVAVFYQIAMQKYTEALRLKSLEYQLKFLATAYNSGLKTPLSTLLQRLHHKRFPYGYTYKGLQYNYAEIALNFYLQEAKQQLKH
jgi:hypothetical protein